jgi:hypothetical protein
MKQTIEQLEQAKLFIQNIATRGNHAYLDRENAKACVERAIALLKDSLCWETPEQREKRTGNPWPDNWAVYGKYHFENPEVEKFELMEHNAAKRDGYDVIVCATEAGRPPDSWEPDGWEPDDWEPGVNDGGQ